MTSNLGIFLPLRVYQEGFQPGGVFAVPDSHYLRSEAANNYREIYAGQMGGLFNDLGFDRDLAGCRQGRRDRFGIME